MYEQRYSILESPSIYVERTRFCPIMLQTSQHGTQNVKTHNRTKSGTFNIYRRRL
jgi:hypothetical protein